MNNHSPVVMMRLEGPRIPTAKNPQQKKSMNEKLKKEMAALDELCARRAKLKLEFMEKFSAIDRDLNKQFAKVSSLVSLLPDGVKQC